MSARLLACLLLVAAAGCGSDKSKTSGDGGVDLCAHSVCMAGDALGATCDSCVQAVCAKDATCCQDTWSATCVSETGTLCSNPCGLALDGGAPDMATGFDPDAGDGTPIRETSCVTEHSLGRALTAVYGRLDGFLVDILAPGQGPKCNGDSTHVHLQVMMGGAVYDVAVNVQDDNGGDVYYLATDAVLPDGPWSEGWHTADGLSYPSTLGLKSTDFTPLDETMLAADIASELATTNHISIFGTGYGPTGMHLIHYNGSLGDGAIVANLGSSTQRVLLFHFVSDTF